DAILRYNLVKATTKGSNLKPIDLVVKYANTISAFYIKYNKNSTYDVSIIFKRLS
ncbi:hypothetical protein QBC39DRAFT_227299, partial [Podospora conica]